jgi:tRNA(Ile2)-agmatinylcytidine synthase
MAVDVSGTLLAFDDTDSPEGMCTTYLAALMVEELDDLDLIGLPRLVRLDPNVPWKTRGNAAICLQFGKGSGRSRLCGSIQGREVRCYGNGRSVDPEELLGRASRVLERVAQFDCDKTNPGIIASKRRPAQGLYWGAVREVVQLRHVENLLGDCGAEWKKYKSGRGVIGAAAAMSWRPRDRTWEIIAYRNPRRFGKPRQIDAKSVVVMDKATRFTFNNYDYESGHIAITPGSPCPILFGIRGDSSAELLRAKDMIKGEKPHRWLLFMTNQGTDDHISRRRIRSLRPMDSALIEAKVVSPPVTIPGKHVILRVTDGDEIDAAFYEPSHRFRDVGRALLPGDAVTLYGSVRDDRMTLNVEKIRVKKLVRDVRKVHNPVCKRCDKSMGSMGAGQGYRCKRCGAKAAESAAMSRTYPRSIKSGWFEPPVASRRHLHKPLRRMSRANIDNL